MVAIGERARRRVLAVLSNMEQPLGNAVGNSLEVAEAVATLRGEGPADLDELCRHQAAELLVLAGRAVSHEEAGSLVEQAICSGAALTKLADVVEAQGGNRGQVLDTETLPHAPVVRPLFSPATGYVSRLDALTIGRAAVRLGAGRATKGERIRHDVGIVLHGKVGDYVEAGGPLLDIHAATDHTAEAAARELLQAYDFEEERLEPLPVLLCVSNTRDAEKGVWP
jgi:pyrimidine-nucleoside phosphorylase